MNTTNLTPDNTSFAPVSGDTIVDSLHWRYAVKQFDASRKIADADWQTFEDTLHLAPSSYGLQPWKFLVVTDQSVKESLIPHAWGQHMVADCSHLVVVCGKKTMTEADVDRLMAATAEARGVESTSLDGYKGMILGSLQSRTSEFIHAWNARQCYLALGVLLSSAALMQIDACPMEGFVPEQFDELLGLTNSDFTATVICALGYRAESDKYAHLAKVRYDKADVFQYIG